MTSEVAPGRVAQPKSTRWILAGAFLLALGGAIVFARSRKAAVGGAGASPVENAALARPIPVVVARASKRDVPVFLDGLGNAVPLVTVTVRPQVDGPLTSIQFQEGQQVKKGDLLARIDPRPFAIQLHQAQAALARDQAQAKNAKVNLARYTALHEQGLATQEQLDDQRATADQLAGTIKADEAQIENAQLQLNYTEVRSPVAGVTGVRQVDQGNIVHASDPNGIVVVTQLDPMAIVFTLPQDNLPQINREIANGLQIEAYSRDGDRLLGRGKLSLVDNQVSLTTATVRLKGIVPNPDKALWPNEFVRARLLLATRSGALSVPAPAVQRGPQGTFVYVVAPDRTAALRSVKVETVQDQWAVIAEGLRDGEQVVVEGQNQLKPGAKVALRSSVTGQGDSPGAPGGEPRAPAEPPAAASKGKPGGAPP